MAKALALISGGLDSILAAKLVKQQGIEVIGICFKSAFFSHENAVKLTEQVGIPLKVIDFTDEHFEMVKNPKHGYGKNMNPCIDCHAMMLRYAGHLMKEMQADFLITGEVLNQRPMSQNMNSLNTVKKESGYEEFILRPLSAKKLAPTKMEIDGLVDREKLMDISGRTRKVQMELAEKWGIIEYPSPAGGCKLTEPSYSSRLKDLLKYNSNCSMRDIEMLRYGRYFRINDRVKIISTREAGELDIVKALVHSDDLVFDAVNCTGSTVILQGNPNEEDIKLAASICGRYSKDKDKDLVLVKYGKSKENIEKEIEIKPAIDEDINKFLII